MQKPEWQPLPREGSVDVEFRVLLQRNRVVVANLRFAEHATIDEHSAASEVDVVCLAGSGYVSTGDKEVRGLKHRRVCRRSQAAAACRDGGAKRAAACRERRCTFDVAL